LVSSGPAIQFFPLFCTMLFFMALLVHDIFTQNVTQHFLFPTIQTSQRCCKWMLFVQQTIRITSHTRTTYSV